ncbi:hypothetical protein RND81_02G017200 [Saponaria officinalis]|uniref:Uncharacterized protein n=1 Tax=Saponaria officinalis TaxID=3572 RepID=A0AAW1MQX9_SAPOF
MSDLNPIPYNLRPRSKVTISTSNLNEQEKAPREQIIDQLPFSEIEDSGVKLSTLKDEEERKKYITAYLDAKGIVRGPRIRVSDEERARSREKRRLRLAETGLSYLNQSSNSVLFL